MICASTINRPFDSIGGVCLQNKLCLCFRYPSRFGS
jgi:hypothetical protein